MIWGEIINSVRKIHLDLIEECSVPVSLTSRDVELNTSSLPFPEAIDDYDEWEELSLPKELQDLIPLHAVERALIEGPLLPIQHIRFHSFLEVERLFASILTLEKEWLQKSKLLTPDKVHFLENACAVGALKISVRSGFQKLKPMKEI
jgi:hypothetical protein